MNQEEFEHAMGKAKAMRAAGDRPDYWQGVMRGLRRRYHGVSFGTEDEHALWMGVHDDRDPARAERGQGYRDGYIPDYCVQNEGDCHTCSLVNYGLDCQNQRVSRA